MKKKVAIAGFRQRHSHEERYSHEENGVNLMAFKQAQVHMMD